MTEIGSKRDYIETDVLRIVSNYGGEVIQAGPRMEAMQGELADLVEQYETRERERIRDGLYGLSLMDCSEVSFGDFDIVLTGKPKSR